MREIGTLMPSSLSPSALAVSPSGRQVAFAIMQADTASNSHCIGLAVVEPGNRHGMRLLNAGGEPILRFLGFRGQILGNGAPETVYPAWSPDGRSIAWLRRDNGSTQVWLVDAATGKARQLTRSVTDVQALAWTRDGTGVVFSTRSGQVAERQALDVEGRSGFHYDDRFAPIMSNWPMPKIAIELSSYVVAVDNAAVREANDEESRLLPGDPVKGIVPLPRAVNAHGMTAEIRASSPNPGSDVLLLSVTDRSGHPVECSAQSCTGALGNLWWQNTSSLVFLRKEGWANGDTALYRWEPGRGQPVQLFRTKDQIADCAVAAAGLVCLREGASRPQRLVTFDMRSGSMSEILDPNPEFRSIRFGKVERLEWRNDAGSEVRGDLVLPPGYRRGHRLPLIVTTYRSSGFLKGAIGDEYPIHAFAAAGFAVLSYNHPRYVSFNDPKLDTMAKMEAAGTRNWSERRDKQSAVMAGIDRVIAMGIADPKRIGISGLSDGASTVQFALINSRRFAAASIGSCCLEPWTVNVGFGPPFAKQMHGQGWARLTDDDRAFWAPGSLVQNAAKIDTPLLMQLADREFLGGVDVYAALKEQGKPVDLFVFPDAYHWKYQPAQRLALYQRNIDWFSFWLQGRVDPDPAKAEQYDRWQTLAATKGGQSGD